MSKKIGSAPPIITLHALELEAKEPFDAAVSVARELGIDGIDCFVGHNFDWTDARVSLSRLSESGMRIASLSCSIALYRGDNPVDDDLRRLRRLIELAAAVECPYANSYFGHSEARDDALSVAVYTARIEPILDFAERNGVQVLIENEFDAFGLDPAGADVTRRPHVLAELLRGCDGRLGLVFDPTNLYFAGAEPFPSGMEELVEYIRIVHVKDGRRSKGSTEWQTYTDTGQTCSTSPFGEGAVNWAGLLQALRAQEFSGHFALEPHCVRPRLEEAWRQTAGRLLGWYRE